MLRIELFWVKEIDNQMTGNTRFFFTRAELNLQEFCLGLSRFFSHLGPGSNEGKNTPVNVLSMGTSFDCAGCEELHILSIELLLPVMAFFFWYSLNRKIIYHHCLNEAEAVRFFSKKNVH